MSGSISNCLAQIENLIVELVIEYTYKHIAENVIRKEISFRHEKFEYPDYYLYTLNILFKQKWNDDDNGIVLAYEFYDLPESGVKVETELFTAEGKILLHKSVFKCAGNKINPDLIKIIQRQGELSLDLTRSYLKSINAI